MTYVSKFRRLVGFYDNHGDEVFTSYVNGVHLYSDAATVQNIMFKVEMKPDGIIRVTGVDDWGKDPYLKHLNEEFWLEEIARSVYNTEVKLYVDAERTAELSYDYNYDDEYDDEDDY